MADKQRGAPHAGGQTSALLSRATRRAVVSNDRAFLYQVYASTRQAELAQTGWNPGQIDAFLRSQFEAQDRYYREVYADASYEVLLWDGVPAGRLYVGRWDNEICIIDIAMLPGYQRQGIGGALLQDLFAEADTVQKPVRIHVEKFNPALNWYTRLGFIPIADREVYLHMERPPRVASVMDTS
jgi:GNAT superfamily N-acetyltransferase